MTNKLNISAIFLYSAINVCLGQIENEMELFKSNLNTSYPITINDVIIPKSIQQLNTEDDKIILKIDGSIASRLTENKPLIKDAFYQTPNDGVPDVPYLNDMNLDYKNNIITLEITKNLTAFEVATLITNLAIARDYIPCWDELSSRDFTKSEKFDKNLFSVRVYNGTTSLKNAWYALPKHKGFSMPIMIGSGNLAFMHIVPYPISGEQPRRYCIRILDANNRILWINDEIALGIIRLTLIDENADGIHEILLSCNTKNGEQKYLAFQEDKLSIRN